MAKNILVAGTDPIELQDYCLQELASHTKDQQVKLTEPAFILVPDALKADVERRYLSKFDVNGLMLAEVLSFERFAYRIFSRAGGLATDSISKIGKSLLIQKIICQRPEQFKRFQRFAGKTGYSDELEKVLRDFKRFDLTETVVQDLAEKAPPSLTKDKISDFSELFKLYHQELNDLQIIDQDDNLNRLIDLLNDEENQDIEFLQNTQIWITGFADIRTFNQQELKIIKSLAKLCKKLTITVLADPNLQNKIRQEIFEPGYQAFKQIISIIPNIQVQILEESTPIEQRLLQEAILSGKLDFALADQLRADQNYELKSTAKIRLLTNEDKRQEWSFIAGEIKRLVNEENYRQKDIGIAITEEATNQSLIKSIFREFGLNAYLTDRLPIKQLPLYRYLEGFLRISNANYLFEDLLSFLRSGLTTATVDEIDTFENICLEFGFKYPDQLENQKYLERIKDQKQQEFFVDFIEIHLRPVFEVTSKMRANKKASAKAGILLAWLADDRFFLHLQNKIDELRKLEEEDIALSLAAAFDVTVQLLEESHALFNVENISQARFTEIILGSLVLQIPNTIPVGLDRIRIGSPQELIYYDCKVLFIVGMSADTFPPVDAENSFFSSKEIEWIEAVSDKTLPDYKKNQLISGLVSSAGLFSRTKDHIYLSTSNPDSEQWASLYIFVDQLLDNELSEKQDNQLNQQRNIFIKNTELLQMIPGDLTYPDQRWLTENRTRRFLNAGQQTFSKKSDEEKIIIKSKNEKELEQKFNLPESATFWYQAIQKLQKDVKTTAKKLVIADSFNSLIHWHNQKNEIISLNQTHYLKLLSKRTFLSASRLENYQACPYQYFSQNILNLQERPIWDIDYRDRGMMVHAMMEIALKEFAQAVANAEDQKSKDKVVEDWLEKIESKNFYDQLYLAAVDSSDLNTYVDPIIRVKDGTRLKRIIRSALIFDSYNNLQADFLPTHFEWQFPPHFNDEKNNLAKDKHYKSLYLINEDDLLGYRISLELNGIIDRIDQNDLKEYRIFDYKTGRKAIDLEKIFYGLDLQLGLYQRVWQHNHPKNNVDSIGYFSFQNPVDTNNKNTIYPPETARNERLIKQKLHKEIKGDTGELEEIGDFSYLKAQQSVKNIISGNISPNPKALKRDDLPCRYCQFKEICGFDQRLIGQRETIYDSLGKDQEILDQISNAVQAFEEKSHYTNETEEA
ncbi:MAG: hypothetical protein GX326_03155 [Clostridiaceae bacterium]|nr:hypothetical protein [Clostridiaceae bacterium]